MSDDIKKQLGAVIDSYKEDLCQMADEIFDLAGKSTRHLIYCAVILKKKDLW